jgi:dipeptidyl aminopeptidase/acylaminoacyl peptidase
VVAPLDNDYTKAIVTRESPTMVPDSYLRDMRSGAETKLTKNVDFAPEVTQAIRKRILVTRPRDDYNFYIDITLPRDYREGTRLPGIVWFYPTEFTTQAEYDQRRRTTNINQFPAVGPRSAEIWATQGYVVIQPVDIPIVGPTGRMNDHYVDELREDLDLTLEAVEKAGYLDRSRVGIGGHSYGAFSTVNAMTHTPYFKAGIAGDGMYNRTLTPFNFQNERRTLWEAKDTYLDMSPFLAADRLSGALLMYHSLEDQNVGTDPISSIRMMQALEGMGKTASLYMYPYEDHGPATRESDLDQWARWLAWFDIYVKNPQKAEPKTNALVP